MAKLNIRREIVIGSITIILFFGVFGLWAALAPLESAAIAPGTIAISGKHKAVQHLEGGIIKNIDIKENSLVKKGQPLITLQPTQAQANLHITRYALYRQQLIKQRLLAELNDKQKLTPPQPQPQPQSKLKDSQRINAMIEAQQSIFSANQSTYQQMMTIHNKRLVELKQQLQGMTQRLKASQRQNEILHKELANIKILADKKLVKQSRLLSLQREDARLDGQIADNKAAIDNQQRKIIETELEVQTTVNKRKKELLAQLHETQQKITELSEKHLAQADVLTRTVIRAPIAGRIVDLKVHTVGGVIAPGEVLMNIVPSQAHLIVEARVSPLDIDIVTPGLVAKVRVSVFQQRDVPLLIGTVTDVSANSLQDQRTGESYYLAQINLPDSEVKKLPGGSLYPGMPAEVMIITHKQTPWQYFIAPIKRSFDHAFREE